MNIAFPAILILIIAFPGVLFLYGYRRYIWWRTSYVFGNLTQEIAFGLGCSILIHFVSICVVHCLTPYRVNFNTILILLTGTYNSNSIHFFSFSQYLTKYTVNIFLYFLIVYIASYYLGLLVKWVIVEKYELDLKHPLLRMPDDWHYLFSGRYLWFSKEKRPNGMIDFAVLTTIVQLDGANWLYRGLVRDYSFDRNGQLHNVYLSVASRRLITDDKQGEEGCDNEKVKKSPPKKEFTEYLNRYYPIDGDYLLIKYENMKTLNLEYYILEEQKEEQSIKEISQPIFPADQINFSPFLW